MFNQVILIGNIGNDIELRYTPSGVAACNFRMGVGKKWKNDSGEAQEKTVWVSVSCWRKTAELVAEYCKKGMRVQVVGELEDSRAFTDKVGNNRASTEVTASNVLFLSRSDDSGNQSSSEIKNHNADDKGEIPF
jgi:single-strand DNA-binding protein